MKKLLFTVAVASALLAFATPSIDPSTVAMTQDPSSRKVTVAYTLSGEAAIVTLDIETNVTDGVWASIGQQNLTYVSGAANRLVTTLGTPSYIYWQPTKAWPNMDVAAGNIRAVVRAWSKSSPPDYMAVDLRVSSNRTYYAAKEAVPGGVTNRLYKTDVMLMRRIPAAGVRWRMGSPDNEVGRNSAREKLHYVQLSDDYYMGVYPVTQAQYLLLADTSVNPSNYTGAERDIHPVEKVSYSSIRGSSWPTGGHDDVASGSVVAKARVLTGLKLDLPTDAQWEYACRAGEGAAMYDGNSLTDSTTDAHADALAWYKGNTSTTMPVGLKPANNWGLYEMYGNTFDWTLDWFADTPYAYGSDVTDPVGPSSAGSAYSNNRTLRGGSYNYNSDRCRSAHRSNCGDTAQPFAGFRLVCPAFEP